MRFRGDYNLWTAQPRRSWRVSFVYSALMLRSWRLNYIRSWRLPLRYCRSRYKKAALPLLSSLFARAQNASQLSILKFQDANPSKAEGKTQALTCAGDYCHQLEPQEGASLAPAPQSEPDPPPPDLQAEAQVEPEQLEGQDELFEVEELPEKKKLFTALTQEQEEEVVESVSGS